LDSMTYGVYGTDISFAKKVEIMESFSYKMPVSGSRTWL
jgi:hypothetical protein